MNKADLPPICWTFQSDGGGHLNITASMPGLDVTFPLRAPYELTNGQKLITADEIIREIKALERTVAETYILNERRKEAR